MKCPYCKSTQIKVIGGRKKDAKVRYRKCFDCGKNFKTIEYYSEETIREVEIWKQSMNC